MTRTRAAGLLLLVCVGFLGWHLIHQSPTATPSVTSSSTLSIYPTSAATRPSAGVTSAAAPRTVASPSTAPTPRADPPSAVTAPATPTPVDADVPQDRGASSGATPGPDQRRVEAEEPSVDQLTDAQLQAALDKQTAGQARLLPALEHAAAAVAWKEVRPNLTGAHTWSDVDRRAAAALLLGQDADPAQPIPVNVVIIWTGTDPDGVLGVHRAETKLLYTDSTWQPLN